MDVRLTTYQDLIDHALDYLGANPGADAGRDARRAVLNALQEFSSEKRWSYYYTRGLLTSNPPQTLGTVQYANATRTVTLTGAFWPAYADQCSLVINNTIYEVNALTDGQNLVLKRSSNPGIDIPAGTSYTLFQDTYPLPVDFLAADRMILNNNAFALCYEHPGVWLERQRIFYAPATPRTYTFTGSPDYMGSMVVRFFPPPDQQYYFSYIYQRKPRSLRTENVNAGTATITNGSATVTGTATSWTSRHVGSVLRLSGDGLNLPTSRFGANAANYERIVASVTSPTVLTADAAFDANYSGVKYTLSDPVDIEEGAMLQALQRCVEKQVGASRDRKTQGNAENLYRMALIKAMEADSRNFAAEVLGPNSPYPYRLAQMPRGPDVS